MANLVRLVPAVLRDVVGAGDHLHLGVLLVPFPDRRDRLLQLVHETTGGRVVVEHSSVALRLDVNDKERLLRLLALHLDSTQRVRQVQPHAAARGRTQAPPLTRRR